ISLFRWFVGLSMDDPVWDVTVFTKNRERLLRGDIAEAFFQRVLELARAERLLSDEHFSVDGTLIQAWAGQKSFVRKGTTPPAPAASRSEQSPAHLPRGKAQQCHARLAHRDGPDGPGGLPAVVARKWPEESLHDSGRACHASPSSQGLTMNGGPGFSEATQLRSGASGLLKKDFMTSGP